jgi:hypothetical protein
MDSKLKKSSTAVVKPVQDDGIWADPSTFPAPANDGKSVDDIMHELFDGKPEPEDYEY